MKRAEKTPEILKKKIIKETLLTVGRRAPYIHTICIEEEEEEKKTNWSYSILDSIEDHKSPFLESHVFSTI